MKLDKKQIYFLVCCICVLITVIGATYAYFTASATDNNTIYGDAATVSFSLSVQRVTTVDMAYGLIPMYNNRSPYAATKKCKDDLNNAVCQIYKITVSADSETVMFLDGYIVTHRKEGVETRISEVLTSDNEETFYTKYTQEDFNNLDFDETKYIKTGVRTSYTDTEFTHEKDYDCLLIENEKIGGDVGTTRIFYMMLWVYDNGENQNYLQGMEKAYSGEVTFQTAEGNEITATFD